MRICPMLAVENMESTLEFYSLVLGFSPIMQTDSYSVVDRDGMRIHFMLAADESVLNAVRGHTDIYIEVEGVEDLWESVKSLDAPHKTKALFDQPYGMREFHIEDPNGVLIFVGEQQSSSKQG